jgi:hypothetical protein
LTRIPDLVLSQAHVIVVKTGMERGQIGVIHVHKHVRMDFEAVVLRGEKGTQQIVVPATKAVPFPSLTELAV